MRGYKAINTDMTTRYGEMTYKLNKVYELDNNFKLELCANGFHFCENLFSVFNYYEAGNCRVFVIDTLDGEVLPAKYDDKICSNKIKLVSELTDDEI